MKKFEISILNLLLYFMGGKYKSLFYHIYPATLGLWKFHFPKRFY